jgi:hypothetical protein
MLDRLLHFIWASRLPSNAQVALAGMPDIELDTAALCADRIIKAVCPSMLASIAPATDTTEFQRHFKELSRKVKNLSSSLTSVPGIIISAPETLAVAPAITALAPGNRSHSRDGAATTKCWCHSRFGANAKKCSQPCTYKSKGKLVQKT